MKWILAVTFFTLISIGTQCQIATNPFVDPQGFRSWLQAMLESRQKKLDAERAANRP